MKKFCLFVMCSVTFGCVSGLAYGNDYDATHPALEVLAFRPVGFFKAKPCECTKGEKCECGDNCTCNEAVGCGKRAAARQAARAAMAGGVAMDEATYSVGFEPQQMAIMQTVPVQQVATVAADPDVCPCCGMKMTPEQKAFMKAKQAAPVQQVVPAQTYTTAPAYYPQQNLGGYFPGYQLGGGQCVGGNCVGGNCGTGGMTVRRWGWR